jgi:hypothetical protein
MSFTPATTASPAPTGPSTRQSSASVPDLDASGPPSSSAASPVNSNDDDTNDPTFEEAEIGELVRHSLMAMLF